MQSISCNKRKKLRGNVYSSFMIFGIYLELEPEEEEKAMLEQNIQVALQSGQIYLRRCY